MGLEARSKLRGREVMVFVDNVSTGANSGASAPNQITITAGQNLSSGRVIVVVDGLAYYYQPSEPTHVGRAFGISKTSASAGNDVIVALGGSVSDAAFSGLSDQALWVGADGELSLIMPDTGNIQKGGHSIGSNTVIIDFSIQINR